MQWDSSNAFLHGFWRKTLHELHFLCDVGERNTQCYCSSPLYIISLRVAAWVELMSLNSSTGFKRLLISSVLSLVLLKVVQTMAQQKLLWFVSEFLQIPAVVGGSAEPLDSPSRSRGCTCNLWTHKIMFESISVPLHLVREKWRAPNARTQLHKCHCRHSLAAISALSQVLPFTSLFWMALSFRQLKFNLQPSVLSLWLKSIWDSQQISWFLCQTQIMILSV